MDGPSITRPPLAVAITLLLLAVGALSLPPIQLTQRADRALYDTWSTVAARTPPPEQIVLVYLRDPAWHQALLNLAHHHGARLVISTLPQPPAGGDTHTAVGPVALASGAAMVVRETDWTRGGHLWIRTDFDGVVRQEWPVLEADTAIPSLALAGARSLTQGTKSADPIGVDTLNLDPQGRRWLRFFGDGFVELTPSELLAAPTALSGKIVIVGREGTGRHATPIGALTTRELIAHSIAGYLEGGSITTASWAAGLGWLIAGITVLALGFMPLSWGVSAAAASLGTAALLLWSALAFLSQAFWQPVAGPALLLLASGCYLAWTRKYPLERRRRPRDTTLTDARRLAARGELEDAWTLYHRMPVSQMMLHELYDLGSALHDQGAEAMATDIFHRIAQVDAGFRDVTNRLADPSQTQTEQPAEEEGRIRHLGRYQLLKEIGRGAMGVVYLGKDPKINRIVAVKAIDMAAEFEAEYVDEARNRFIREAETAGRLNHPNIVTIFDVGEEKDFAYIAMEFLKGRRLDDFAEPDKLLPVPLVLELVARTAEALDYAHNHDVVHRDIKPANIMYDSSSDTLKITDFGIARLMDVNRTQTGIVLGTPSFMSPEQLEGENVNGHTDLFALGISLFQLLTGHLPFRGASMTELMFVIANEPHVPVTSIRADLPECLDRILDQALAKDPASRYESGAEMALALREAVAEVG